MRERVRAKKTGMKVAGERGAAGDIKDRREGERESGEIAS